MKARTAFPHLLFAMFLLFVAPIALARVVLYVDGVHGSDNNNCRSRQSACKTIGHAISLASPGYVISVAPATYQEILTINFDLGIAGDSAATTIVDGGGRNTVVTIPNNNTIVVLAGLTIRNGNGSFGDGGGIVNGGGIVTIYDSVMLKTKSPPGVCLGRARVDNRWAMFSLLTLCFQEYLLTLNPFHHKSCVMKV